MPDIAEGWTLSTRQVAVTVVYDVPVAHPADVAPSDTDVLAVFEAADRVDEWFDSDVTGVAVVQPAAPALALVTPAARGLAA